MSIQHVLLVSTFNQFAFRDLRFSFRIQLTWICSNVSSSTSSTLSLLSDFFDAFLQVPFGLGELSGSTNQWSSSLVFQRLHLASLISTALAALNIIAIC